MTEINSSRTEPVDALVIAAHPDDAEMICGGTIAKLTASGRRVAIIDMVRGEMGTRGTVEQRDLEAAEAAKVLGVCERINLNLPDGRLENCEDYRKLVIEQIRRLRPKIVMTHWWEDLHPDHAATGQIVRDTMYPVGFEKFPAGGDPYRPNEYLFFLAHFTTTPNLVVDITGYHEVKMKSIECYRSQLHSDRTDEPSTNISQPDFLAYLESRSRFFGKQIGRSFGEPFVTRRPVPVSDPVALYEPFTKI